jgi:hypothetical protein
MKFHLRKFRERRLEFVITVNYLLGRWNYQLIRVPYQPKDELSFTAPRRPRNRTRFIYLFIYLFKSDKGQLTATNISQKLKLNKGV